MKEVWKDIEGWEGYYQISNIGRARSLPRRVFHHKHNSLVTYRGRVLKTRKMSPVKQRKYPYPQVVLCRKNKQHRRAVHRLVAEAFIPNPHNLPMVLHKDDNPDNASARNLRWGTAYMNSQDKRCPHRGGFLHHE